MNMKTAPKKPNVYLPGLLNLSSDDLSQYISINISRIDLVNQLSEAGMFVPSIANNHSWLKNMLDHAEQSDAFIFPPMTSLPENHPLFKSEAAQRWFEFFSLVTGIHVGNHEKYGKDGFSKPCVVMDPDGQWSLAINLLKDLSKKGMFNSRAEDFVQIAPNTAAIDDYHAMNKNAVNTLQRAIDEKKGRIQKAIPAKYGSNYNFTSSRAPTTPHRHPFGVVFFGSATTKDFSYMNAVFKLAKMVSARGWRMITGAGTDGCMGAACRGFNEGREEFNNCYPKAPFKPAHIGVSTQSILRLEGPPDDLDQLIITDNIYNRMEVIIKGQKSQTQKERLSDTARVFFVAPGGTGTLQEFTTLMQLATNGTMMEGRTIVLLNLPSHLNKAHGFWDPLIKIAKKLGFNNLFVIARSPEEAIKIADQSYEAWLKQHKYHFALQHPL